MSDDIRMIEHGVALRKLRPAPVSCFVGERVVACFLLLTEMTSIYARMWDERVVVRYTPGGLTFAARS